MSSTDSFRALADLQVGGRTYKYYRLQALAEQGIGDVSRLPYSLKVLLENLLRFEDASTVTRDDIVALASKTGTGAVDKEIAFRPARVLMQDFTGVPGVVDLAAMRDTLAQRGSDPALVNPLTQVDLVIDHSVMVDHFASDTAYRDNVAIEMERNRERYQFLRWGQSAFDNFRVVPPGTGICHQVNLEYLAKGVWTRNEGDVTWAYPDSLVGTDSHTTMINGLGVLGWGVGGIEAEAAMLGQPISMLIPDVVGFKLSGALTEGVTATDLVLTVVEMLRKHGVVGKFVEFFGSGLNYLPLADRATLANMAPEYGATCGFFTFDQETLNYLSLSGREDETIALVEAYAKAQGLWRDDAVEADYNAVLQLDLGAVVPSVAGPKRPQDRVALRDLGRAVDELVALSGRADSPGVDVDDADYLLTDGDVVIAAITSCTNTSNPAVMMAAGLVAKKAVEKGLVRQPWVKPSLAPGSKVVTDYLAKAGLQTYLDQLGFNLVGYGCTTCIGNSGPLAPNLEAAIERGNLTVSSVLSGNRNFEGRIHSLVRANWLASPPLVVAFALAGTTRIDLTADPLGTNASGEKIYLRDIWPSNQEVAAAMTMVDRSMFLREYADVFTGDEAWRALPIPTGNTYDWDSGSTYVRNPPFFDSAAGSPLDDIQGARMLALLGDSVTTDHISPAGNIESHSPAGQYLLTHNVAEADFNSYGSRRGNHEVMMRGTFANVRIKNELVPGVEGGYTRMIPGEEQLPIYDAAMAYQQQGVPLVVIAGAEYGTGSSRDWAAKGTRLLGVRAVIAESYERIHRSNLIGMGVLPLQFIGGQTRNTLQLDGSEKIHIVGIGELKPGQQVAMIVERADGERVNCVLLCRIDTDNEAEYYASGGILHYVLNQLAQS